ncbi:MAG: helix-turn-helix domain-containing protein [Bacteroidia bacterium]
MNYLAQNIKYLRKKAKLTQAELAEKIGVKRAVIGTYEEQKAEPKLKTLRLLAKYFGYNIHEIVEEKLDAFTKTTVDISGKYLRVLPVLINQSSEHENVSLVPVKASAGYLTGHTDPDYIGNLPQFQLPFSELSSNRTYRVFQTNGDSMLPIESGSYIISEYVEDWHHIADYACYILVTKNDGVVYKRVINKLNHSQELILVSDNKIYKPYNLSADNIIEVWKAVGVVTFALPSGNSQEVNLQNINDSLAEIKKDLQSLKTRG